MPTCEIPEADLPTSAQNQRQCVTVFRWQLAGSRDGVDMPDGYSRLIEPDSRTLHFGNQGLLPGPMRPDDAVTVQQAAISRATLSTVVPTQLAESFERLRDRHVRGVVDYATFAETSNDALRLYEPALKQRFVEFYQGHDIPFARSDGTVAPLKAVDYAAVYKYVRNHGAPLGVNVASGRRVPFNGMLGGLLDWARHAGLLRGQRARHHEESVLRMRNSASHGEGYRLEPPLTSAMELHDLAEFINQLWGQPTVGGRLYPAPVQRELLALGTCGDGATVLGHAATLTPDEDPTVAWVLLAGVLPLSPHWAGFDSRFQTTTLPTQYLWGPGNAIEALAWMTEQQPTLGTVDPIDQLVLIRHDRTDVYLPQQPEVAAALPRKDQTGDWRLMLTDQPMNAFACARSRINGDTDHQSDCRCATTLLARGTWQKMRHRLAELRPDLTTDPRAATAPQLPPDLRIGCGWRTPRSMTVNRAAR
jgi:hypothetical protein